LKRDKRLVKEIMGKKRLYDVIKIERNAYYSQHQLMFMQQERSHGLTGRMKKYMKAPMIMNRNTIHKIIHRKNAVNIPVRPSAYKLALNKITQNIFLPDMHCSAASNPRSLEPNKNRPWILLCQHEAPLLSRYLVSLFSWRAFLISLPLPEAPLLSRNLVSLFSWWAFLISLPLAFTV
jgi:hypothetical protein